VALDAPSSKYDGRISTLPGLDNNLANSFSVIRIYDGTYKFGLMYLEGLDTGGDCNQKQIYAGNTDPIKFLQSEIIGVIPILVFYINGHIYFGKSTNSFDINFSTFSVHEAYTSSSTGLSLCYMNNLPYVVFANGSNMYLLTSNTNLPGSSSNWSITNISPTGTLDISNVSIAKNADNTTLLISYKDDITDYICYCEVVPGTSYTHSFVYPIGDSGFKTSFGDAIRFWYDVPTIIATFNHVASSRSKIMLLVGKKTHPSSASDWTSHTVKDSLQDGYINGGFEFASFSPLSGKNYMGETLYGTYSYVNDDSPIKIFNISG
jgi:hypothetical protein